MSKVSIVMGSDSDLSCMCEAAKILERFEVDCEITIASAHRSPERLINYVKEAEDRGISVFIAGAGGAAHLPGVIAALTPLPVIGVPMVTKALGGLDSLYSIVQMPAGIPVATMSIGGAKNAGIMAASILGASDKAIRESVRTYKDTLECEVTEKGKRLEAMGYHSYLEQMK